MYIDTQWLLNGEGTWAFKYKRWDKTLQYKIQYLQTQVVHLSSGWVYGIRISGPPAYGAGPWIWGHSERSTCPDPSSDPPMGPDGDLL